MTSVPDPSIICPILIILAEGRTIVTKDLLDMINKVHNFFNDVKMLKCHNKKERSAMDMSNNSEKVFITVGPPGNPYAKIIREERRLGINDRRRLNTYIDRDRRGGLAERRKSIVPQLRRLRTEDRRQSHTYLAKDKRNGIADRRNPKKILPTWWRG